MKKELVKGVAMLVLIVMMALATAVVTANEKSESKPTTYENVEIAAVPR